MYVYAVLGGNFYEGYESATLGVFADTPEGKLMAEDYAESLKTESQYDKVLVDRIRVLEKYSDDHE